MPIRALVYLIAFALSAAGETNVTHLWEMKQYNQIQELDRKLNGVLGVATIDLTSGRVFVYNGDAIFPTASSIKIAIMLEMFRADKAGRLHFSDVQTLNPRDDVGGSSGPLEAKMTAGPIQVTVRELMENMIIHSDNTATNRCIDLVGMDAVNRLVARLGLRNTHLRRKMMDLEAAAQGRRECFHAARVGAPGRVDLSRHRRRYGILAAPCSM